MTRASVERASVASERAILSCVTTELLASMRGRQPVNFRSTSHVPIPDTQRVSSQPACHFLSNPEKRTKWAGDVWVWDAPRFGM